MRSQASKWANRKQAVAWRTVGAARSGPDLGSEAMELDFDWVR